MNQFTKCSSTRSFGISEARFNRDDNMVSVNGQNICRVNAFDLQGMDGAETANGELIAKTFTSSTIVSEQGYNAEKVIENLPEILNQLQRLHSLLKINDTQKSVEELLEKIKK